MQPSLTLDQARRKILQRTSSTDSEILQLADVLGRIPVNTILALLSQPGYDQSSYDGYVISKKLPHGKSGFLEYSLAGEIAAGDTKDNRVTHEKAYRIMTGGAIPKGGWKVIPQELCRVDGNVIQIAKSQVMSGESNIRKKGNEQRPGGIVAPAGMMLKPQQLGRLADAGYKSLTVHRHPRISFFCTGSELVDSQGRQEKGKKLSSNRYLLNGLIRSLGGIAKDRGTVSDSITKMCDHLRDITISSASDIIISTGGMGPGKYDLLKETFHRMDGEVIFTSLKLRPGKSVLFGMLGKSLYFGLPGPPTAVRALFHVLVRPAILKAQGLKKLNQNMVRAFLEEDLVVKKTGIPKLQEGIVSLAKGMCTVRPAKKNENSNCYLLYPGRRKAFSKGELMTVHLLRSPLAQISLG